MNELNPKRITLFCGHYGSGKTNLAVNYALRLRTAGLPVAIGDLDIVNPYFRTKDSEEELKSAGVEVIALPFAGSNVDLPAIPSEAYGLVQNRSRYAIMDIGGDDRGAYALGRFSADIVAEDNFENLFVVNFFRPLTPDPQSALEIMKEIESVSRVPFTAIVNNSNLGADTGPEDIIGSGRKAIELSALTGLPLVMTGVDERLMKAASAEEKAALIKLPGLFSMNLQKRPVE